MQNDNDEWDDPILYFNYALWQDRIFQQKNTYN